MTELTHDEIQRLKIENAELREQLEQATTRAEAAEAELDVEHTENAKMALELLCRRNGWPLPPGSEPPPAAPVEQEKP